MKLKHPRLNSVLAGWVLSLLATGCAAPDAEESTTGPILAPVIVVAPDVALGTPWNGERGALNQAVSALTGPAQLQLQPGHYYLEPQTYQDPTCGNCEDPAQAVPGTVGLVISGANVSLLGAGADSVFIHTSAGYGLLFDGCEGCLLRGITVTGGKRDPDPRATNGAVVARASSVTLQRCTLRDNIGDPETVTQTVVGIAGIVGREGSDLDIRNCLINRNSWDGIALYRDSEADIRGTTIDGVDRATGTAIGGGRGVGIGVTWNAKAVIEENLVQRYWKGIGAFGDAHVQIRENVVEEVTTWGIALSSAEGAVTGFVEQNVVFRSGACGLLVDVPGSDGVAGTVAKNLIVETTLDSTYDTGHPYCPQQPLARVGAPKSWQIRGNLFHQNRVPGPAEDEELDLETMIAQAMRLYTFEIEPQRATTRSEFIATYQEAFGPPFR
ncbi:MAG: right-handed parallel beta-helix repeat-containing protein [Longimicrobiales bacterium]